jgi:hypothetical protein
MSKVKRLVPLAALLAAASVLTGCSGINASHSVSPASFFLPGLIQHEPEPKRPVTDPDAEPVQEVALLSVASH